MTMIGFDFYGTHFFRSPGSAVRNINYAELKNGIYDEVEIREATNVLKDPSKSEWQPDTAAIFKFMNDLEGGNITNSGLKIVSFQIRRRKSNELNGYTLATVPFQNKVQVEYVDYTQSNEDYIYSIVPLAENALDGKAVSVEAVSDFTGYWLVDKETGTVLGFDRSIGEPEDVSVQLNQGRTVIETLSKYPAIYYSEKEYNTFSLETVIIPEEMERSGIKYEDILNSFVREHRPFLVKSSNGKVYVCDVSNPTYTSPKNSWSGYDYGVLKVDLTEIGSYSDYMNGVI